jgi:hypothetical protein
MEELGGLVEIVWLVPLISHAYKMSGSNPPNPPNPTKT